jgi:hypothetical protein
MDEKWRTKYWGKYLGIVRDWYDPENLGRLRIEIPEIYGIGEEKWSPWALPCLSPGRYDVPREGEAVWVEFRNGEPDKPIWVGWLPRGSGETSTLPENTKELCSEPTEMGDPLPCADCRDKGEHIPDKNKEAYYDHLPFHDHLQGKYHCPRKARYVLLPTESGHAIHFSDKEGEEYLQIIDSEGNKISLWHDTYGGIWIEDKAGQQIRMQYNYGIDMTDKLGQKISIRNGDEGIFAEIMDAEGQKVRLEPEKGLIEIKDKADQYIEMSAPSGTITLSPNSLVIINGSLLVEGMII